MRADLPRPSPTRRVCQRSRRSILVTLHALSGASMLSPGTSCTVHSLKARPELNGRRGVVVSQLDEGGRVGVQVEGEAKPLSLKPTNLDVVSAPPASSRAGADSAASSVDSKTLARFVTAHSIRASGAAKRQFAEEMRAGVALGNFDVARSSERIDGRGGRCRSTERRVTGAQGPL